MPSILVIYNGDKVDTRELPRRFRGLAWDEKGASLILVGNAGRVLKIQDGNRGVKLETGTTHNLRSVSINPIDNTALAVGNAGTVIAIRANNTLTKMNSPTFENLRAVRWNADGTMALIPGNNGTLIKYTEEGLQAINDGRANLRGISWRKNTQKALITSNCFAEEFIPSPNLFLFDAKGHVLTPVNEGRSDLIGVDWNPDGDFAMVVGYDVVWHNGFIGRYDESGLSPVEFQNSHVYPTAVRWDPKGRVAAIATSAPEPHSSQGRIILWDGRDLREIYRNEDFFFSNIAWSPAGCKLAAIASTRTRTFDS